MKYFQKLPHCSKDNNLFYCLLTMTIINLTQLILYTIETITTHFNFCLDQLQTNNYNLNEVNMNNFCQCNTF